MEDQEKNEQSEAAKPQEPGTNGLEPDSPQPPEPEGPQPPEPAVKSRSEQVQATIDRNLAEKAARQKLTDEVIAKRKQTAALEAQPAAEAEQKAEADRAALPETAKPIVLPEPGEKVAADATAEIVDTVKKDAKARELREIEMHNAQMDSMNALVETLSDINAALKEIAQSLQNIAEKA